VFRDLESVHLRQVDVEQNQVGLQFSGLLDGLQAIRGLGNLKFRPALKLRTNETAERCMVFYEENLQHPDHRAAFLVPVVGRTAVGLRRDVGDAKYSPMVTKRHHVIGGQSLSSSPALESDVLKRRHIYVLLFAAPALLVSIIAAAMMLAASAGFLWLFVLGDDTWPPATDTMLGAVFVLGGAGLWLASLWVGYQIGKRQESRPRMNIGHVVLSIGATVGLAAVIVVRLMAPNGFGHPSDSLICADFCRAARFAASGTPPQNSGDRTCSCYDANGREARRVPLSEAAVGKR